MLLGKFGRLLSVGLVLSTVSSCDSDRLSTADPVWTLYSIGPTNGREHVATFDSDPHPGDKIGNKGRCEEVRRLFEAHRKGRSYRCDLGRFRER